MKAIENVTACVVDYGNFVSLADKLGETYKKVYYYTPYETEYREVARCVTGRGVPTIERCDEPFTPEVLAKIDLFVFPDIGYAKLQRHLEEMGKKVWGSREVTEIELKRSLFLEALETMGLPVPKSEVVHGLKALDKFLKDVEDVWIKIDFYREDMETWHHIDYEHSLPMLRYMAAQFGGYAEHVVFVVQECIADAQEQGYDGYSVDGKFPAISFQGYEKKNELYLGSWLKAEEMPEHVAKVNEAIAPFLRKANYRNFFATEIRNEFFIDPTPRMAGQSQEHLLETCTNLAEIIWAGANGVLVEPEFCAQFAASATLHYKEIPGDGWKEVNIPKGVKQWFKLSNYMQDGTAYHFPPGRNDEIGVVIGLGDTVEEAINQIKANLQVVEKEPISAEVEGFVDILKDIEKAEAKGDKFSDKPLPEPEFVVKE